jgi:hypothetical protein
MPNLPQSSLFTARLHIAITRRPTIASLGTRIDLGTALHFAVASPTSHNFRIQSPHSTVENIPSHCCLFTQSRLPAALLQQAPFK